MCRASPPLEQVQFVIRYYSRGKKPKIIRRAEALASITQAQMNIVAVGEDGIPTYPQDTSRARRWWPTAPKRTGGH